MRTKCPTCLCRKCLKTCCTKKKCNDKKTSCKNYIGFQQLSIFENLTNRKYQAVPRHSWDHYGITTKRYMQLTRYIQSGKYDSLAISAAHAANKTISEHILLSIKENLSYEGLEKMWGRGEIERIPYCRTDFYGIRRYFLHLFDLELRRIGK